MQRQTVCFSIPEATKLPAQRAEVRPQRGVATTTIGDLPVAEAPPRVPGEVETHNERNGREMIARAGDAQRKQQTNEADQNEQQTVLAMRCVSSAIERGMAGSIVPSRREGKVVSDVDRRVISSPSVLRDGRTPRRHIGGQLDLNNNNDEPASSIFMMETQVMGVEGAPAGSKLLYYPVSVCKHTTQALLDSGASVNCIDADLADRARGVITRRAKGVLLYPDKRQADVKGITELEVRVKGYKERITFWVVKGLGIPMLLSEPWLRSWNPTINWQTKDMTFSDGVVWRAVNKGYKQAERSKGRRWRPMGERRMIHLILGSEEDDEGTNEGESEPEIPTWLSDMTDVFREPIGVLCDGRLEHCIRVREGARPYQKAPYRLSPEQTEVLHKELKEFKDKGWIRPSRSE